MARRGRIKDFLERAVPWALQNLNLDPVEVLEDLEGDAGDDMIKGLEEMGMPELESEEELEWFQEDLVLTLALQISKQMRPDLAPAF